MTKLKTRITDEEVETLIQENRHDRIIQEIIMERKLLTLIRKRLTNKQLLPAFLIQDIEDIIKKHDVKIRESRLPWRKVENI